MGTTLIENLEQFADIKKIGEINLENPQYGDFTLSVMPFENTGEFIKLPVGFEIWERDFNEILKYIPLNEGTNTHYLTIDSKFFTTNDFLRREGIHIDGNFCADPDRSYATWGGVRVLKTWAGISVTPEMKIVKDWESPYDFEIPFGTYISSEKGGILTVSNEVGCQAWTGRFFGLIMDGGDCHNLANQFTEENKTVLDKNGLYFMTSNTPHETLIIEKGMRRTFMRITLNHEYPNHLIK